MKVLALIALLALVGCSSPTAPTPVPPPVAVVPPVVVPPPVVTPPTPVRNPLLDDPRFSLSFYRMLVLDAFDSKGATRPLYRQTQAPKIYLRTVHEVTGAAIDSATLSQTAAALEDVAGKLTGVFGLAGLEQGTGTRAGQPGWIMVYWNNDPDRRLCGEGSAGGNWIALYTNTPGCRCAGGPLIRPRIIKHELGHVLGFYHTDSPTDLMYAGGSACDMNPSERELFHARIAYAQPIGSFDPQ